MKDNGNIGNYTFCRTKQLPQTRDPEKELSINTALFISVCHYDANDNSDAWLAFSRSVALSDTRRSYTRAEQLARSEYTHDQIHSPIARLFCLR